MGGECNNTTMECSIFIESAVSHHGLPRLVVDVETRMAPRALLWVTPAAATNEISGGLRRSTLHHVLLELLPSLALLLWLYTNMGMYNYELIFAFGPGRVGFNLDLEILHLNLHLFIHVSIASTEFPFLHVSGTRV